MYQTSNDTPGSNFGDQTVIEAYKLIVTDLDSPALHQQAVQDFLNALRALPNRVAYIRRVNTFYTPQDGPFLHKLMTEISYTLVGTAGLLP